MLQREEDLQEIVQLVGKGRKGAERGGGGKGRIPVGAPQRFVGPKELIFGTQAPKESGAGVSQPNLYPKLMGGGSEWRLSFFAWGEKKSTA